ncbi:hypothetical protein DENIS_0976 [Desulfonema ishimotonii]|uniref:CBS domain-containing protein n=1 Tax=Desulfonema ishimotonii TaxID=45657 RepID=A0A401FST9_9BACT|nr:CBS domain-containing protein [Desulfonema ishimotonii]GBC60034.1 hypothetical protein DENIS_0976 [Desulfonema ishimotonii]
MKTTVKDLMIPLSEYATVSMDATLSDAVMALGQAQEQFSQKKYPHRAILIYDENKKVIGKVSQLDILRSLEPKYDEMLTHKKSLGLGFTRKFQRAMLEQLRLWEAPMKDICRKAAEQKVTSFMTTPEEGEYIEAGKNLNEAIHQLVMGNHQSLLVLENKEIIGILKLTDVFQAIADEIIKCAI